MSPFTTNQQSNEVFTQEVVQKDTENLIVALMCIALCFGVDRTEKAIQNTYTKADAGMIIKAVNLVMENTVIV